MSRNAPETTSDQIEHMIWNGFGAMRKASCGLSSEKLAADLIAASAGVLVDLMPATDNPDRLVDAFTRILSEQLRLRVRLAQAERIADQLASRVRLEDLPALGGLIEDEGLRGRFVTHQHRDEPAPGPGAA